VTVVVIPVATFWIATNAWGTNLPEGSVIVPERFPPATWPRAGTEKQIQHIKAIAAKQEYKYSAENFREDT
jgi:hypothetical protein